MYVDSMITWHSGPSAVARGASARRGAGHVSYVIHLHAGLIILSAYVAATCGAAMFSGYHHIAILGVVNLIAVAAVARLAIDGFASL
jgi:hypothetical protein